MALCDEPDFIRGYWLAVEGGERPKGRHSKAFTFGYRHGRWTYCARRWCDKHGLRGIADGPRPPHDPLPHSEIEIETWLKANP